METAVYLLANPHMLILDLHVHPPSFTLYSFHLHLHHPPALNKLPPSPSSLCILGHGRVKVGIDSRREIVDPVANQVVNAKRRSVVARRRDRRGGISKRQRALRSRVDARDARVRVAPERAADTGGRDLVVGRVDVGALFENGVDGAYVRRGDIVAADMLVGDEGRNRDNNKQPGVLRQLTMPSATTGRRLCR